ncbi:MAG: phosphomannomutase, partial [bacterium]|nr:phosphomannomutase [bacterium]
MHVDQLMQTSGVTFGTSGARGLAVEMTDEVCYVYTRAFLAYLASCKRLKPGSSVAVGGDLRPSTPRIMAAAAKAVIDSGLQVINCGPLPSPALALYGIATGVPSVMVTGSHIPDDRNGIKYNTAAGEVTKDDEAGITSQRVSVPDMLFDVNGSLA